MVVFVDGKQILDRQQLTDPVRKNGEIYVAQALSGGSPHGLSPARNDSQTHGIASGTMCPRNDS
jgi:hypothetical protein